jgi:transposase InsO family protein
VLRQAFAAWGRPGQLRVDNGTPWGSAGDLPTDLVLWLAGLGVPVRANRPRRPQDNGVVERSQGTGKRWGDPASAASAAALQAAMDRMDRIQREEYPYEGGRSRLAVHPGLRHSGRPYSAAWERRHWGVAGAYELLAGFVVARQIDRCGSVSVYHRNYYVGKAHAGEAAWVGFDPQQRRWLFSDSQGHLLNQHPATEVSAANIRALTVSHRRGSPAGGKT